MNLEKLIAHSVSEYDSLLAELVTSRSALHEAKKQLSDTRESALFDTKKYTKHYEDALVKALENVNQGSKDDIFA